MNHFCDPVSALLRVEVKCGRNIINLDDDDGSDPYVEVAVVQPDGTEEKHQTHYIDDATDPEWNSTFNFIAAKPYKADLVFRMYDYDGVTSYDDLIGMVRIPISELQTHKGITKFPDSQWYTLLDAEGKDCDKEGTKYGDIEIRAYLDEEYFEHLHGGNTSKAVGKLTVGRFGGKRFRRRAGHVRHGQNWAILVEIIRSKGAKQSAMERAFEIPNHGTERTGDGRGVQFI